MKITIKSVLFAVQTTFHMGSLAPVSVIIGLLLLGFSHHASAGNTWNGGGADNNWSTTQNWNPVGAPAYGTISFTGTTRTTNTLNGNFTSAANTSMNQINWNNSTGWLMNNSGGFGLSLYDNGGTQSKVENLGTGIVTINAPITFAANNASPPNPFGEINAVSGDITFASGNTLTVNGSSCNGIKMYGSNHILTFNNTVSSSGKWFAYTGLSGHTLNLGGSFTCSDFYVMNGATLNLNSGGTLTGNVRLGGDFATTGSQNQTLTGVFNLTVTNGNQSFSGVINSVAGNTSGTLAVNSENTSNTNTLSGHIALDSNLKITQSAGGTLNLTQAHTDGATAATGLDLKGQALTVTAASTAAVNISGTIYSSTSNPNSTVVHNGAGITTLSGTVDNAFAQGDVTAGILVLAKNPSSSSVHALGGNTETVAGGTLQLGGSGGDQIANSANVTIASGTFDLNGQSETINALTLAGTGISNGGALINSGSAATLTLDAASIFTNGASIGGSGDITIAGTVALKGATTGAVLNKVGTHKLTLSNGASVDNVDLILSVSNGTVVLNKTGTAVGGAHCVGGLNVGSGSTVQLSGSGNGEIYEQAAATVGGGGVLDLNGQSQAFSGTGSLTINGTGISGGGALINSSSSASTNTGPLILGTDSSVSNGSGGLILAGIISGTSKALTKIGTGTLTLQGANSYTGNTVISAGTLALSSSGSLNSGSTVSLAAGATLDVSAVASPYNWGGSASLVAAGTGATIGSNAAAIKGASGGTVSLGSRPVLLTWGGGVSGIDSTHPALTISQGTLALSGNAFTVVVPGSALGAGVYTLITTPGAISGTVSATPAYTGGNGVASGTTGVISISNSNVILTVSPAITASAGANGSISPSGATTVTYNGNQTYTITPNPGFSVANVLVDGISQGPVSSYTFNNVTAAHTISASFAINTYTVTYDGNGNTGGTAPVDGSSPYNYNTNTATVTVLGAGSLTKTGYAFAGWNTAANGSGTSYSASATFAAVANVTLYAQWNLATPTITGAATAAAFTTTYGTASSSQSFAIFGTNLTTSIIATAPAGFEVSCDNATFGSTANFSQSGGIVSSNLFVRLAATATVSGSYDAKNIVLSSAGASDVNITTAASGNTVSKATATVTLTNLSQTYDGAAKSANATTTPPGLTVNLTYGGSANAPTNAGTYQVVGVISDTNYQGSATNNLVISRAVTAVAVSSSHPTNGYLSSVFFTAVLPANVTGSVIFLTNSVWFDTQTLTNGSASSLAIANLPRGSNRITAEYAGDGNFLGSTNDLTGGQIVTNHPPVANHSSYSRNGFISWKIAVADLLTNASDVIDGDTLSLTGVGVSSNNVTLSIDGGYVLYANTNLVDDSFSYTVSDGYGGTNSATVLLTVGSFNGVGGQGNSVAFTNGAPSLTFEGIPGYKYQVETSTNLTDWNTIWTTNAPAGGKFLFNDTNPPQPSAYYRLMWNGN